jgi:hypothetical protein
VQTVVFPLSAAPSKTTALSKAMPAKGLT